MRACTAAVFAVLTMVGVSGCSDPTLADLLDDHSWSSGSSGEYHSKLANPEIVTAKSARLRDLCTVVTSEEVAAALQRAPSPPQPRMFGCVWHAPTQFADMHDTVRVSTAGLDSRGDRTVVRGNSALQRRTALGCEVMVATHRPTDPDQITVPEIALDVDSLADPHRDTCPAARALVERAFDRLPPGEP